ncbi:MAG: alpha/beta hydrolase [Solirubrobacterales bacterium]
MRLPPLPSSLERGFGHATGALPAPVKRVLSGRPIRVDGQTLHPDAQLLLASERRLGIGIDLGAPAAEQRAMVERQERLVHGATIAVGSVSERTVPSPGGSLPARLYVPAGAPQRGPLTVYLHGGGWVVGGLDTHDQVCRLLCREADVRVLSVAYRLAPEHPFPAAVEDAVAALRHALGDASELGADPTAISIAGDSAGANLATVACRIVRDEGGPLPVLQGLIYPRCDMTRRYRSRDLFAEGFYLTEAELSTWEPLYTAGHDLADTRLSPLRADDLSGLPGAYVLVAGFDPFRDEVGAYAAALADAGVPVTVGSELDLFHGFVSAVGISARFRAALGRLAAAISEASRASPPGDARSAHATRDS